MYEVQIHDVILVPIQPKNDIDVYLSQLIEDLKLSDHGIEVFTGFAN